MEQARIEKYLYWIILAGIFFIPFLPLLVVPQMIAPEVVPRTLLFRTIIEIIGSAWLLLALLNKTHRPTKSWILGSFVIFIVIAALADILGINPSRSFLGNYGRMEGWIQVFHLFFFLLVLSSVIKSERLWRAFWHTNLGISILVCILGLLQLNQNMGILRKLPDWRVTSTFQTSSYFAGYLLFIIFIAALLWYQKKKEGTGQIGLNYFYGASMVFAVIMLFLSGARGAMLGLVTGGFLTLGLLSILYPTPKIRKWILKLTISLIIIGVLFILGRNISIVRHIAPLHRLASISLNDSTVRTRLLNMEIAWNGFKERPILGWGQENYSFVYTKYYDPRMYGQGEYDRVHNIFFDWLIAGGLLGLLGYIGIYIAVLRIIWRRDILELPEKAILTGLLTGYLVHNLALFDDTTSYIFFASILAYVVWRECKATKAAILKDFNFNSKYIYVTALPLLIITIISIKFLNISPASAAVALQQGTSLHQGVTLQNLNDFKYGISHSLFGVQDANELLAQTTLLIATHPEVVNEEVARQFYSESVKRLDDQIKHTAYDVHTRLLLVDIYRAYNSPDKAFELLKETLVLSPKRQDVLLVMAQFALIKKDFSQALEYAKMAYEVNTEIVEVRLNYAVIAILGGHDKIADELLTELVNNGNLTDPRIIRAYASRNQVDKIAQLAITHIKARPVDPWGYFLLASLYFSSGQDQASIQTLQKLGEMRPSNMTEVKNFILEIQNKSKSRGEILKELVTPVGLY